MAQAMTPPIQPWHREAAEAAREFLICGPPSPLQVLDHPDCVDDLASIIASHAPALHPSQEAAALLRRVLKEEPTMPDSDGHGRKVYACCGCWEGDDHNDRCIMVAIEQFLVEHNADELSVAELAAVQPVKAEAGEADQCPRCGHHPGKHNQRGCNVLEAMEAGARMPDGGKLIDRVEINCSCALPYGMVPERQAAAAKDKKAAAFIAASRLALPTLIEVILAYEAAHEARERHDAIYLNTSAFETVRRAESALTAALKKLEGAI